MSMIFILLSFNVAHIQSRVRCNQKFSTPITGSNTVNFVGVIEEPIAHFRYIEHLRFAYNSCLSLLYFSKSVCNPAYCAAYNVT